ncbi:predicted protein [Brucella abortus bv. 4 str. 292]|uniref:Uncharacterized protein n=10 Tax=Brucella TaxID=234 RepID=Q2YJU7_BRUA2|nr:hypothetical protein BruAb2_0920 [Brucella abortus bv. 1 str. 9-941]ABQ62718.1 hypothetical protein BOV_A0235 [Brucella ovis ATCC 25840]ABX63450.1 Hypothetical protein, conserved [Brucella canis ATCC 23365]ABY39276.1 Hypothetical protein, conserved [Brucella suis ATCC 23445]ACD74362.1 hypothetical protein BAbS19_II08730 [Brucella abortus S19]ACU49389.1 hypothetical protein BMI_II253 [Brucella microti CCM 4915]AEK55706.1 hypothetical protein BPI_II254 [Brucella pinnipedialis B2/94]EEH13610
MKNHNFYWAIPLIEERICAARRLKNSGAALVLCLNANNREDHAEYNLTI